MHTNVLQLSHKLHSTGGFLTKGYDDFCDNFHIITGTV